ncbi:hypothetical protein FS749_002925 [Ceratobasidium sp. UAMH 11750]|nr:hypothetical protein FS749_002925 [Ceratobasidium sp. UAMH 11750]
MLALSTHAQVERALATHLPISSFHRSYRPYPLCYLYALICPPASTRPSNNVSPPPPPPGRVRPVLQHLSQQPHRESRRVMRYSTHPHGVLDRHGIPDRHDIPDRHGGPDVALLGQPSAGIGIVSADLHQRRVHGERSVRGRRRKAAQRARSASRKSNGNGTDMQTDIDELQTDVGEHRTDADDLWADVDDNDTAHTQVDASNADTQADTDNLPVTTDSAPAKAPARRGRKSKPKSITISKPQPKRPRNTRKRDRSPSRSPTPGSTDVDPAELDFVTGKTQAGSQYTYVYETVDHSNLLRIAEKKLGENMDGHSTQEILEKLRVAAEAKTPALATKRYNTSVHRLVIARAHRCRRRLAVQPATLSSGRLQLAFCGIASSQAWLGCLGRAGA